MCTVNICACITLNQFKIRGRLEKEYERRNKTSRQLARLLERGIRQSDQTIANYCCQEGRRSVRRTRNQQPSHALLWLHWTQPDRNGVALNVKRQKEHLLFSFSIPLSISLLSHSLGAPSLMRAAQEGYFSCITLFDVL